MKVYRLDEVYIPGSAALQLDMRAALSSRGSSSRTRGVVMWAAKRGSGSPMGGLIYSHKSAHTFGANMAVPQQRKEESDERQAGRKSRAGTCSDLLTLALQPTAALSVLSTMQKGGDCIGSMRVHFMIPGSRSDTKAVCAVFDIPNLQYSKARPESEPKPRTPLQYTSAFHQSNSTLEARRSQLDLEATQHEWITGE